MTYLLDTCVIAELASPNPDPAVTRWLDSQPEEIVFISVVTLAEIKQSIEQEASIAKKALLNNWLMSDLLVRFSGRISEFSVGTTLKWSEFSLKWKALKHTLSVADSLNLAIALFYDHTLVTRDVAIFEDTGVKVMNPFSPKES